MINPEPIREYIEIPELITEDQQKYIDMLMSWHVDYDPMIVIGGTDE